jgi:2-polyprenyl-3-methyl-5-hydroxy-6-metoxy-1,4-benzoquinol methylase
MDYHNVYKGCFSNPSYSAHHHIQYDYVIQHMKENLQVAPKSVIDIGSGRGQLIRMIRNHYPETEITSADLEKFHQESVSNFIQCDLSKAECREELKKTATYDLATCTDVFEHLDESFIEDVIATLAELAPNAIYAIANHSDVINGIELHTIQRDHTWWIVLLEKYYTILDFKSDYDGRLYQFTLKRK